MKKELLVKTLALGIVILFINIGFQPVFAADIKPTDGTLIESSSGNNEKVEYVIQIIKTNKVIENKVYLTQQQAIDLENLIDNIRADLNNSDSIEETSEIYNDAINSFDNLNLFPEDITGDEIKQLVSGKTQKLNLIKFKKELGDGFENRLCFVAGDSGNTIIISPFLNLASFVISLLILIVFRLYWFFLMGIGGISFFGMSHLEPNSRIVFYYPAWGWIFTIGLNGVKYYSGYFFGNLIDVNPSSLGTYYPGIFGFTGISIYRKSKGVFYLGFALRVAVTPGEPYP